MLLKNNFKFMEVYVMEKTMNTFVKTFKEMTDNMPCRTCGEIKPENPNPRNEFWQSANIIMGEYICDGRTYIIRYDRCNSNMLTIIDMCDHGIHYHSDNGINFNIATSAIHLSIADIPRELRSYEASKKYDARIRKIMRIFYNKYRNDIKV